KWVGSRFETMVSDHHGRAAELTGELALDRDGRFLGLRIQWICNVGAYLSQAGPLINTLNPSTHAINVYRIPALYGRHRLALTNTTPITAYRGAGRPNVSYLVERLVDEAARETGIDRIELRRRNFIPKDAFPYKTPVGSTYDSGNPEGYLHDALEHADWAGFARRREQSQRRGATRAGRDQVRRVGQSVALRALRPVRPGTRDRVHRARGARIRHTGRVDRVPRERPERSTPAGRGHHWLTLRNGARQRLGRHGAGRNQEGARLRRQGAGSRAGRRRIPRRALHGEGHRPGHHFPAGSAALSPRARYDRGHCRPDVLSGRRACRRSGDRPGHRRRRDPQLCGGRRLRARDQPRAARRPDL